MSDKATSMHKPLITADMALATLSSTLAGAQPQYGPPGQQGRHGPPGQQGPQGANPGPQGQPAPQNGCYPGESRSDCRQRLTVQQRTHHQYVWNNGRYEDQNANGAAAALTIFGFILNAAIVGSTSDRDYYNYHRNDHAWQTRCRSSYRSFNSSNGTYLGRDGYRHYCTR